MNLFMQSLPEGSQFQIISFGEKFETMRIGNQGGNSFIDYNQ
jgi:hypothetical protein